MLTKRWDEQCEPNRFRILGIPISIVNLARAVNLIVQWGNEFRSRTVFVREVPSLMHAVDDPRFGRLHDDADLVVPDGMPLVWIGRWNQLGSQVGRVAGADLVEAVCEVSQATKLRHFFYGGGPGVAVEMARRLKARHPGIQVAGTYTPPIRSLGPDLEIDRDMAEELAYISSTSPDVIWVGLSSPKQEYWMMKAAPALDSGVFIGVGAAFDFHAGTKQRAPRWMQTNGLEWLHRLWSEPSRLWYRYCVLVPRFAVRAVYECAKLKMRKLAGRVDNASHS